MIRRMSRRLSDIAGTNGMPCFVTEIILPIEFVRELDLKKGEELDLKKGEELDFEIYEKIIKITRQHITPIQK